MICGSHQKKHLKITELVLTHSEDMIEMEKLPHLELPEIKDDIGMSLKMTKQRTIKNCNKQPSTEPSLSQKENEKLFYTQESPLEIKNCHSKDKSQNLKDTQTTIESKTMKLLQTSLVESTLKDADLKPFWTLRKQALSNVLWLPTKTDLPDSHTNSWKISLEDGKLNLQSSVKRVKKRVQKRNWQTTYLQSYMSSQLEQTEGSDMIKSLKIKAIPLPKTKTILKMWFSHARITYDNALVMGNSKDNEISIFDAVKLKKECVTNSNLPTWCKWLSKTPASIRAEAVRQMCKAAKSSLQKGDKFRMKTIKSRNPNTLIIGLEKTKIKFENTYDDNTGKEKVFLSLFKNSGNVKLEIKDKKPVLEWLLQYKNKTKEEKCDGFLQFNRNTGKFYFCLPYKEEDSPFEKTEKMPKKECVALDPGVRKFQTYYSPQGECGELCPGLKEELMERYDKISQLQSKIDTNILNKKEKNKIRRKIRRLFQKCRNIRENKHYGAIKYLNDNFKRILLPSFQTSKMCEKGDGKRKIFRKTAKEMLSLGHYEFKQKCLFKLGNRVSILGEAYTSKTCTLCGTLNTNLKGSEVFSCDSCEGIFDRDVNGARNIFLKHHEPTKELLGEMYAELIN